MKGLFVSTVTAAFILAMVSMANAGYWVTGPNGQPVYMPSCWYNNYGYYVCG